MSLQPPELPSKPEYNTRIREIPATDRPRERLRDNGPSALSNAELLAIILRSGTAEQSVLRLAESLLARHDGLRGLARLAFPDLVREKGVGPAKAAEVMAAFQLGLRVSALQPEERLYVRSPADVYNLQGVEMALLDQEHLRVMLLNTRNQLLDTKEVYKGNVNSSLVRASEVFRDAVRQNAPCLIVVHNHPSGDPSPSPDDVVLTKTLVEAGDLLQIEVLDHVVIGDRRYVSLKQQGMWPKATP